MSTASIETVAAQNAPVTQRFFAGHRSFVKKELRQSAFVLLLGVAGILCGLVGFVEYTSLSHLSLATGEAAFLAAWIAVPFAIALGLSQSIEFNFRSSLFLLHMPITREQLIRAKLILGGTVLLICFGIPILAISIAYSMPVHGEPFFWSMTGDLWRVAACSSMVYLAAFLCGIMPTNWFGTRLLPILGICLFGIAIQIIPFWWLAAPPLILFVDWLLLWTILHFAETRDYA